MKNAKIKSILCMLAITNVLTNCSTHPDKISTQYVSPLQYNDYTCKHIAAEMQRPSVRVAEVGGKQEKAAR